MKDFIISESGTLVVRGAHNTSLHERGEFGGPCGDVEDERRPGQRWWWRGRGIAGFCASAALPGSASMSDRVSILPSSPDVVDEPGSALLLRLHTRSACPLPPPPLPAQGFRLRVLTKQ